MDEPEPDDAPAAGSDSGADLLENVRGLAFLAQQLLGGGLLTQFAAPLAFQFVDPNGFADALQESQKAFRFQGVWFSAVLLEKAEEHVLDMVLDLRLLGLRPARGSGNGFVKTMHYP